MLAVALLGQEDSTGQRITFIVIGLLLVALLLAILTAWYYRVTDPGPRQGRRQGGAGGSRGGGTVVSRGPDPSPEPGWRRRLKGFSVPASQGAASKTQPPQASEDQHSRPQTPKRRAHDVEPVKPASEATEARETVSLEGGYYLDLTGAPKAPEPKTNVGSLNSLDLRQPAPLVDPGEQVAVPVPTVPKPQSVQEATPAPVITSHSTSEDPPGLSFDEWLADVESTEDQ